ncbi:MAG: triosephosphate isomerase, partial [Clostridia bacterium]|nr:triosephosphate isomerase [Clostridia bacterium]
MRKPIMAGHWKMNKLPCEGSALVEELKAKVADAKCDVVVCVPFVDLCAVVKACEGTNIKVGAQNMHWAPSGAYTGEIAANMLVDAGCKYVIIGHSERRAMGETDADVNAKVLAALEAGLV